ncbi:hypothetical protein C8Q79DRAFT_219160 [Trametes meyenii]|nr:hypothetical protein C8Q79DRAFT_219160 [Trametes meyenii]
MPYKCLPGRVNVRHNLVSCNHHHSDPYHRHRHHYPHPYSSIHIRPSSSDSCIMPSRSSEGSGLRDSPSALGFLSRGIQSVSSLVGNISALFSSSGLGVRAHRSLTGDEGLVTPHGNEVSDDQAQYPSSSDSSSGNLAHGMALASGSEDDSPAWTSQDEQATGQLSLVAENSTRRLVTMLGSRAVSAASPHRPAPTIRTEIVHPRRVVESSSRRARATFPAPTWHPRPRPSSRGVVTGVTRLGMPLRRYDAVADMRAMSTTATAGSSTAETDRSPSPPLPRRGVLRRQQVYIEGQDPSELIPESELRGRDPRAIPGNEYWDASAWGPRPTMEGIQAELPLPSTWYVVRWLHRRYGYRTEPFFQAAYHLFPEGSEYRPHFERIVRTSEWRSQGDDWMGGIEPIDRVREPARADDAADSQADVESVGYISEDDYRNFSGDEYAPQAGPSSMAPVPPSAVASSSRSPGPPFPRASWSSYASLGAGSSSVGSSRRQKRARELDSDAEPSATSSADEEPPTIRRRLNPRLLTKGSSSVHRHRTVSRNLRLAPRNTSFRASLMLPPPTPSTPSGPASPPPTAARPPTPRAATPIPGALGDDLPQIVVTPPSPCAPQCSEGEPPAGHASGSGSSSDSSQYLSPPSPFLRPRRHSRRRSMSFAQPHAGSGTTSARRNVDGGGAMLPPPLPSLPGPSRPPKRTRDQAEEEGSDNAPFPEDAEPKKKRPKKDY